MYSGVAILATVADRLFSHPEHDYVLSRVHYGNKTYFCEAQLPPRFSWLGPTCVFEQVAGEGEATRYKTRIGALWARSKIQPHGEAPVLIEPLKRS